MKRLVSFALFALASLACAKPLIASPPGKPAIKLTVHSGGASAPDTVWGSIPCGAPSPVVQCGLNVNASGGTVTVAAPAFVNVGQAGSIAIVCPAPGATISVTGSLFSVATGYTNSPPTAAATFTQVCPSKTAPQPGPFTITFVVKSGG